jgi:catechol 2,3-dioxygenase-like lactoylglutathione lyase family enzyme
VSAKKLQATRRRASDRRRFLKQAVGAGATLAAAGAGGGVGRAQASNPYVRFDHVSFPMRNTGAMLAFYRDLGFQVNEGDRICSVHFGDAKINLHRPEIWESGEFTLRAPRAVPPCGDFCVVWGGSAAELERTFERVGAVVIETGPRQGGRNGGVDTGISRYIRDPDGNLLEFIIYP